MHIGPPPSANKTTAEICSPLPNSPPLYMQPTLFALPTAMNTMKLAAKISTALILLLIFPPRGLIKFLKLELPLVGVHVT
jgi:hypothetical protein